MKIKNQNTHIYTSTKKNDEALVEFIKIIISNKYGFTIHDCKSKSRRRPDVMFRHICMYMIYKNTSLSLALVGRHFNRDHSTVVHSNRVINNHLFWDKKLQAEIEEIQQTITAKCQTMNFDLNEEFYYVELNDINSIKLTQNKSIILSGFNSRQIGYIANKLFTDKDFIKMGEFQETQAHKNTGMYILEKRNKKTSSEKQEGKRTTEE